MLNWKDVMMKQEKYKDLVREAENRALLAQTISMYLTPLGTVHLHCAASHAPRLTEKYGRPVVRVSWYVLPWPPRVGFVRFTTCLTSSFRSTISLSGSL